MEGLQRSTTSFRRQGSSGLVWDDRFLSGELNKINNNNDNNTNKQEQQLQHQHNQHPRKGLNPIVTVQRSRSTGAYRTGKVSPTPIDPPSPKLSACGFCGAFAKIGDNRGQRSAKAPPRNKHRRSR